MSCIYNRKQDKKYSRKGECVLVGAEVFLSVIFPDGSFLSISEYGRSAFLDGVFDTVLQTRLQISNP
jgi:hypothetical protein